MEPSQPAFTIPSQLGWDESVKKGKFVTKIFFQIVLNEVLKVIKKMLSAHIKTDEKQKIKELVAASYNFLQKYLLKT